ncbi:hypothetical protein DERF_009742 [Dermatophagoides farinae]|uniref:Uncharacterized protein n=1 Tax=Dermatophagoides farinae TaxID=6954 RepID=A0A922HVL4_DERFA|nr:hypothetical protein DERF_009742 [Dermatophagoides farinae]
MSRLFTSHGRVQKYQIKDHKYGVNFEFFLLSILKLSQRQEKIKNDPVNMINQSMIVFRNMIDKFLSDIRHGGGATTFTSGRC